MTNSTTRLFGLAGVEVVGVELDEDDLPILALVTRDERARCCPGCGVRSERPHSWVRTRPRDLPAAGRGTSLTWTKRRWRCVNPDCGRRTFTEALPQIPPRSRLTARLRASVGASVADGGRRGRDSNSQGRSSTAFGAGPVAGRVASPWRMVDGSNVRGPEDPTSGFQPGTFPLGQPSMR